METDSQDVMVAKLLLDHLKLRGFQFQRVAPGEDGPLVGSWSAGHWIDTIYIGGFSHDCSAWRKRRSSLIVAENGLVERSVGGSAITVLKEVLTWESKP